MALKLTTSHLEDSIGVFRYYKKLAERAMEQVSDDQLFATVDEEANSIAVIVAAGFGRVAGLTALVTVNSADGPTLP